MDTRQYEYVLAVAELGNFSLAADKCFITQSTISTMVSRFEDEIGVQIFDRKTKPVSITKEGEAIITQLKVIHKEISTLHDVVQNLRGEVSGDLKMGIIHTVAPYLLPEFLNEFIAKFPQINFSVSEMTTENIEDALEKRDLDIGIIAIPVEHKDLVEIPLYDEPFVIFDCRKNLGKEAVTPVSVNDNKFWLLDDAHCLHTQVINICEEQNRVRDADENFNFKAGSVESLIRFVKINNGITYLPYLASLEFLPADAKKLSYFKPPVPVRTIGLIVHRHFAKHHLLRALKREIQTKINPLIKTFEKEYVVSPLKVSD